jgi:hypothetical protein
MQEEALVANLSGVRSTCCTCARSFSSAETRVGTVNRNIAVLGSNTLCKQGGFMCKVQGERDINLAHRMQAVGVPLKLEEFEECLTVHQDKQPLVNSIASRYLTRTYLGITITIYITIVSNSRIPLALRGLRVWLPWADIPVVLLQDPADPFAPEIYRFPGETSGGFHRSELIPQSGKTLTRGQPVEGFLLGTHGDPIPRSFRHGDEIPVVLVIEDQFGETYSRELFVMVDRSTEWRPKPKPPRLRRSLFDKPDGPEREAQPEVTTMEATAGCYVKNRT